MFFDGVLPRFSLYGVVPCSRNRSKTFSSCQVSCFGFVLSFLGFLSASFWFSCGSEFCQAIFCSLFRAFVFPFSFSFFSSSLLLLFFGLVRVSLRLFCSLPWQASAVARQEQHSVACTFAFFLPFSLPGPAPLSLPPPCSLSLSLSLSLSFPSPSFFFLSFSPACICGYRGERLSGPSLQG